MDYWNLWEERMADEVYKKAHSKIRLENILYYYAMKEHVRLDAPTIVGLDITSKCNLHCKHCFQNERVIPNELTSIEWKKVISDLKNMGVYQIYIMGGEPFIKEDIFEILEYVKNAGMTLSINTNATLISPQMAKSLGGIFDSRFDYIQVSLDGATQQINDAIRGKGQFNIIKEKITLLKQNGISVRVNSVVNQSNFQEMSELYELCDSLKVDRIAFTTMYPYKRDMLLSLPDDNKCIEEFNRLLKKANELNNHVLIDQDPICIPYKLDYFKKFMSENYEKSPMLVCRAGLYSCEIDPTGDVYPCTFMHYPKYKAGNVRKESIEEIWKDDSRWITMLDKQEHLNHICKECEYVEKCKGGCIAAGMDTGTGIGGGDPRCFEIKRQFFSENVEKE